MMAYNNGKTSLDKMKRQLRWLHMNMKQWSIKLTYYANISLKEVNRIQCINN